MSTLPSDPSRFLPVCRISCNGTLLPRAVGLIALEVLQASDGTGSATLRFLALSAQRDFNEILQVVPLGATLEVALGHGTQVETVFAGTVSAYRLQLSESAAPEMMFEAASHAAQALLQEDVVITVQYGATLLQLDAGRTVAQSPAPAAPDTPASTLQGQAVLSGTTAPRPGTLLALRGVGDAFAGNLRIVTVRQVFARDSWTTRIDFRDA